MRSRSLFALAIVVVSTAALLASDPAREQKFQQAIDLIESKGDIAHALPLLEDAAKSTDRVLAARALLYLAQVRERQNSAFARQTYERIARDYPEQTEVVGAARTRLASHEFSTARTKDNAIAVRKVWDGPDVSRYGSVSRDGRFLSYMDSVTGDLGIRDMTTGQQRRITALTNKSKEFAEYSVFSRDAKRLAYGWSAADGRYELRTISREGGDARRLYANGNWLEPKDWSPNGRDVLTVIVRDDHTRQLVFISADDGSTRALKTLDWNMGIPERAEFSPDGRFVAYDLRAGSGRTRDVFVIAVDGSREMPVATGPSDEGLLGWLPDGASVLVSSDRTGSISAWAVNVRDGQPQGDLRLVKPDIGQITSEGFTTAGDFFYYVHVGAPDIWVGSMDPGTGRVTERPVPLPMRPSTSRYAPSWSPDSEHVAFRLQPTMNVGIQSAKTGELHVVPLKLSYAEAPTWTPDGTSLLMVGSNLDPHPGIYKVNASTGSAEMVVDVKGGVGAVALSPDGDWLFYRSFEDQPRGLPDTVVTARSLKTGQHRELYRQHEGGISSFWLSPDGNWLAFRTNSDAGFALEVMPSIGGTPRAILQAKKADAKWGGATWSADGRSILLVRDGALWRIPLGGDPPEKLDLSVPGMSALSLSPDGRRLAIGVLDTKEEIWSMQNVVSATRIGR